MTACDKEPIHIPGCVQPHGILFLLKEPQLEILQVSDNTLSFLGIPPGDLLNNTLETFLDEGQINYLKESLSPEELQFVNPLKLSVKLPGEKQIFDGIIHRSDGG